MLFGASSRLPLMALSVRNTIGRVLSPTLIGSAMPAPYSAKQLALAKESHDFWISKLAGPVVTAGLLGCEDGEWSFLMGAVGDRGEAHGPFQWHMNPRGNDIKKYLKIDILAENVTHLDYLNAAYGEMTTKWPGNIYRVWPKLMELRNADETSVETVLVTLYERSKLQARDIARRTALANYWFDYAQNNWSAAA